MPRFPAAFADWQYRAPLTYVKDYVGSGGVTNFPYLVPWTTAPASLWANALASGADLRLTGTDGETEVNFELTSFSPGSSAMEMWGLGASIGSAVNTELGYVYWGNAGASAKPAAWGQGVWSAAQANLVYHLHDLTTSTVQDYTSNGLTGTKASANNPLQATGQIGNGQAYDGSGDSIAFGSTSPVSFDIWANPTLDATIRYQTFWHIGSYSAPTGGFWLTGSDNGSSNVTLWYYKTGVGVGSATWNSVLTFGSWEHLCLVVDAVTPQAILYKNGSSLGAKALTNPVMPTGTGYLGTLAGAASGQKWKGTLDEFRIYTDQRTAAETLTSYNNQYTPALTVLWGAVEENTGGGWRMRRWNPFIMPGQNPGFMLFS